mgnify:CR=1 FL=1
MIKNILCFAFLLMCTNVAMGADRGCLERIRQAQNAFDANYCRKHPKASGCQTLRKELAQLREKLKNQK